MDTPTTSAPAFEFRVPAVPLTPRLKRRSTHQPYPPHAVYVTGEPTSSAAVYTANPLLSPTSPGGMKPTSSLARRRRSLIMASPAGASVAGAASLLHRVVTDPGPNHNNIVGGHNSNGGQRMNGANYDDNDDDDEVMSQAAAIVAEPDNALREFDSIEQAMTLLSLHPATSSQAHWPDPEELLKESLRQSLSALRALREAKGAIRGIEERRMSEGEPMSAGTHSRSIFDVEGLFDTVVTELKGAKEALGWAEQQMEMEKDVLRERLLKG